MNFPEMFRGKPKPKAEPKLDVIINKAVELRTLEKAERTALIQAKEGWILRQADRARKGHRREEQERSRHH
ncbi:MAG: hypothetical protein WBK28_01555 [Minisyncoccia bacterium]